MFIFFNTFRFKRTLKMAEILKKFFSNKKRNTSLGLHETLWDFLEDAIVVLDSDLKIIALNSKARYIFDLALPKENKMFSLDFLISKGCFDSSIIKKLKFCVCDKKSGHQGYHQIVLKDSENKYKKWQFKLDCIQNPNNPKDSIIMMVGRDIGEIDEVREKMKVYQRYIINSSELIAMLDKNMKITLFNQAFTDLTQLSENEVKGELFHKVMDPYFKENNFYEKAKECLKSIKIQFQVWCYSSQLKAVYLDVNLDPVYDIMGNVSGVAISARDITKMWNAEQKYIQVLSASEDGFWELNLNKRKHLELSKKINLMLDYEPNEFDNNNWATLPVIHKTDKNRILKEFKSILKSGENNFRMEYKAYPKKNKGKSKGFKTILARGTVVERSESGFPLKIIGAVTDISEIKRKQVELRKSKVEAEKANAAKSVFIANLSHEIRTPMNAIIGYTDLLSKMPFDDIQQEYLNNIKVCGSSLLSFINDLLDQSKIEAGAMKIQHESINLRALFSEIKSNFLFEANQKNLDFEITIDENLPYSLLIDEVRLKQVIFNIVGNAIKFTDIGYVKCNVSFVSKDVASDIDLIVKISDTGIGIPTGQKSVIFEAFKQPKGQSSRKYGGFGLGLSISKKIVELMNGTIDLKSKPQEGSTFTITIPDVKIGEHNLHINFHDEVENRFESRQYSNKLKTEFVLCNIQFETMEESVKDNFRSSLRSTCVPAFNKARETELSDDILKFCSQILLLGKKFELNNLVDYSNRLKKSSINFELESIQYYFLEFDKCLKSFF